MPAPSWWLVLGLMIMMLVFMRMRIRERSKPKTRETKESIREAQTSTDSFQDSVQKLLVEMQETGRELIGRVDTKARVLDQLIQEADQKAAQLKELVERAERAADQAARSAAAAAASAANQVAETRAARDDVRRAPEPPEDSRTLAVRDTRTRAVYACADRGLNSIQIEKETGLPRGEVELMLRMRELSKGGGGAKRPTPPRPRRSERERASRASAAPVIPPASTPAQVPDMVAPGPTPAPEPAPDSTLADDHADLSREEIEGLDRRTP